MEERRSQDGRRDKLFELLQEARDAAIRNETNLEGFKESLERRRGYIDIAFDKHENRINSLERARWILTGAVGIMGAFGAWALKKIGLGGLL